MKDEVRLLPVDSRLRGNDILRIVAKKRGYEVHTSYPICFILSRVQSSSSMTVSTTSRGSDRSSFVVVVVDRVSRTGVSFSVVVVVVVFFSVSIFVTISDRDTSMKVSENVPENCR